MTVSITNTCIPFHEWQGLGGPYTFMGNLKREFDRRQLKLCPTLTDCRQLLFPVSYDPGKLHWGRARGIQFIVRLDGIYYPEKHGDEYRRLNQPIREIYQQFADFVIFQSDYSRRQCFELFGEKSPDNYCVIINGADSAIFYPNATHHMGDTIRFITTGNFRDQAMLEPVLLALDAAQLNRRFQLHIVGPVADELLPMLNRDYVVHHGSKSLEETASQLRNADMFLYSHLNPPCPNSVIEAISTGLPVVGFRSGAMTELLPFADELLADAPDVVFQAWDDLKAENLREKIEYAVENYSRLRETALSHAGDYPFSKCADEYLAVIDRVNSRSRPQLSRTASWVHGRIGRLTSRLLRRTGIDLAIRGAALEVLSCCPRAEFGRFMMEALQRRTTHQTPSDALRMLFEFDKHVYELEGPQAIRYDNGVHTKHRHMQYHAFFVRNVQATDRVLDLGCGRGELASSVAEAVSKGAVYGIDYRQESIDLATKNYSSHQHNLTFVHGDITTDLPGLSFDVVILSNVLEHIDKRVQLLRKCIELFAPRQFLIRVPMYQRDWRVPLMDELGFDYRLDPEHFIEYTPESFAAEMELASLKIAHVEYRWGEIWSCLIPR